MHYVTYTDVKSSAKENKELAMTTSVKNEAIDVRGIECEEAMMCVRHTIRAKRLTRGHELSVVTSSKPFLSLLTAWAFSADHQVSHTDMATEGDITVTIVLA